MDSNNTPPKAKSLLQENIDHNVKVIHYIEAAQLKQRTRAEKAADAVAKFAGGMIFVHVHIVWFALWLGLNTLLPPSARWDPFPFGVLTMITSLEAIFLSTFILISQNREQRLSEQRNELLLQISLLNEQETSKIIKHLYEIIEHLKVPTQTPEDLDLAEEVDTHALAEEVRDMIDHVMEEDLPPGNNP
jgi:uncharacterized membrane protein